jgi:hypothetical protein
LITKEPSSGHSKAGKYFLRECKKPCHEQNLLKQYSEAVSMLQGHSEHNVCRRLWSHIYVRSCDF